MQVKSINELVESDVPMQGGGGRLEDRFITLDSSRPTHVQLLSYSRDTVNNIYCTYTEQ